MENQRLSWELVWEDLTKDDLLRSKQAKKGVNVGLEFFHFLSLILLTDRRWLRASALSSRSREPGIDSRPVKNQTGDVNFLSKTFAPARQHHEVSIEHVFHTRQTSTFFFPLTPITKLIFIGFILILFSSKKFLF